MSGNPVILPQMLFLADIANKLRLEIYSDFNIHTREKFSVLDLIDFFFKDFNYFSFLKNCCSITVVPIFPERRREGMRERNIDWFPLIHALCLFVGVFLGGVIFPNCFT